MNRPLSQLLYHRIQEGPISPRIITLHKYNQHGEDVQAYGVAAAPNGRVISLESYKGVFIGRDIVGYTWFVGPQHQPSPLFFGDALAEIEKFLWDEIDRQQTPTAELPFLVGVEQGGIMALGTAAAVPDLLSGVIAVDAFLPIVPGWEPPLAPLDNLPILLINDPSQTPPVGVLAGKALADQLTAWGARVTVATAPVNTVPTREMAAWVAVQTPRHHTSTAS